MPKGSHVGGYDPITLLYMVMVFAAALFVPALLARFISSPGPPDSDSDEGGGGGGGSPQPPTPPKPPRGGVPIDDAQPARVRLRDGRRLPQRLPGRQRRPAREPAHSPARRSPTSTRLLG
jgi:hypothetical protein